MRHYKKGRKLGSDASHTAAIKKNLITNLFLNDRIKTTLERAKEIRGDVDRIITWAKRGDVHSRRLAIAKLGDKQLVAEIFAKVEQGLFRDRPGGYSRIYKVGKRRGDDAIIVLMELVQEPVQFKKKAAEDTAAEKSGLKVEKKSSKAKKDDTAEIESADGLEEASDKETEELETEANVVEADGEEAVSEEAALDSEETAVETAEEIDEAAASEAAPSDSEDAAEEPSQEEAAEKPAEEKAATEETSNEEASVPEVSEDTAQEEAVEETTTPEMSVDEAAAEEKAAEPEAEEKAAEDESEK